MFLRRLALFALLSVPASLPGSDSVVTNVADLFSLTADDIGRGRPFRFSGQVLIKNDDMMILRDATGAEMLGDTNAFRRAYVEGDLVTVSGIVLRNTRFSPYGYRVRDVAVTGHADLPPIRDVPTGRIYDGDDIYKFVRLRGVVESVKRQDLGTTWNWITLRTPSGKAGVAARETSYPLSRLKQLVNAEVSVCGIVVRTWGTPRTLGAHLSLRGTNAIDIISQPDPDPFLAPPLKHADVLRRQRLAGTVQAIGRKMFLLVTPEGWRVVVFPDDKSPVPDFGARVTVAGFTERKPYCLTVQNARVRIDGPSSIRPTAPTPFSAATLSRGWTQMETIRVRGRVVSVVRNEKALSEFTLENPDMRIAVDVSALALRAKALPELGADAEASGAFICEHEPPTPAEAFPRLRRYLLLPRTADDIVILSRPSRWTNARVLGVVLFLLGVIGLVLILNRMLQRTIGRRSKALFDEHAARLQAETKVNERTHLSVELHDSLSQMLTGVALQVDSATRANAGQNAAVERFLDLSVKMLASCRRELQSCLWEMRSRTFAEKDMTEAIRKTIEPYAQSVKALIRFNVPRQMFSESSAHAVLKIVRELVANAVRHGHAATVRIAGECHDDLVRFSVRDDGVGFDSSHTAGPSEGHFGLQGVLERVKAFTGTLTVDSHPGQGTAVTVTMKIRSPNADEE